MVGVGGVAMVDECVQHGRALAAAEHTGDEQDSPGPAEPRSTHRAEYTDRPLERATGRGGYVRMSVGSIRSNAPPSRRTSSTASSTRIGRATKNAGQKAERRKAGASVL